MFFGQLEEYCPKIKTYVFTDDKKSLPSDCEAVLYDKNDMFRTQYLECLPSVKEDFLIYLNEDYILYDQVNFEKIIEYRNVLRRHADISCIRFTLGNNITSQKLSEDLFFLSHDKPFFYSQTASLWRKQDLKKIHELGPNTHIGLQGLKYGHFEEDANKVCKDLELKGLIARNGESVRHGSQHYDSFIFPYIATAIIKGRWNLKEYSNELLPLFLKYNINPNKRGVLH